MRLLRGDVAQARALHHQALVQLQEHEPGGLTMADALVEMACVEAGAGLDDRAQRLLGANDVWYAAHGGTVRCGDQIPRIPGNPALSASRPSQRTLRSGRREPKDER